jgi:hypothetical protein
MTRKNDLPPAPEGKVRVIDKAEFLGVTLTDDGFEAVLEVEEHHLEDR